MVIIINPYYFADEKPKNNEIITTVLFLFSHDLFNELISFDSQTRNDLIGMEFPQMEIYQMKMSLIQFEKPNKTLMGLRVHDNLLFVCWFACFHAGN